MSACTCMYVSKCACTCSHLLSLGPLSFLHADGCPEYAGFKFFNSLNTISSNTLQNLLVNATFKCPGVVRAWRYIFLTPTTEVQFNLQVWRLEGSYATRVGSTQITVAAVDTDGVEEVTIYLEEEERILVQPGDFLGVYAPLGASSVPIAANRFSTDKINGSEAYSFQVSSGIEPTVLNLQESDGIADNVAANLQGITGNQCACILPRYN